MNKTLFVEGKISSRHSVTKRKVRRIRKAPKKADTRFTLKAILPKGIKVNIFCGQGIEGKAGWMSDTELKGHDLKLRCVSPVYVGADGSQIEHEGPKKTQ